MKGKFSRYILPLLLFIYGLSFAQDGTTIPENREDSVALVTSLRNQVREAIIKQDISSVLTNLNRANELATLLKDSELQAETSNDLAEFYSRVQNHDLAVTEVDKSIALLKDKPNSRVLADALLLKATFFIHESEFNSAANNLDKAYDIYEALDDESDMAKVQLHKGLLAVERGNATGAVNYIDAALSTFEALEMDYFHAWANLNKSKALLMLAEQGDTARLDQAKATLERALVKSRENSYLVLLTDSKLVKSDIAKFEQNYNEAYTYLQSYYVTQDSLQHLSRSVMEQEIKLRLERGDYDEIIANLRESIARKDSTITMNNFTSTLSIALIIILSFANPYHFTRITTCAPKQTIYYRTKTANCNWPKKKQRRLLLPKHNF